MITLNLDAATEQALKAIAQTEKISIEEVLAEALQLYHHAEKLENQELNEIANTRLSDGSTLIRVSLNDL
jgi:predicted nucleic-acid-binding protein